MKVRKPLFIAIGALIAFIVGWFTILPVGIPVPAWVKLNNFSRLDVGFDRGNLQISQILWRTPWQSGIEIGMEETVSFEISNGQVVTRSSVRPHLSLVMSADRHKVCFQEKEPTPESGFLQFHRTHCFEAWRKPYIEMLPAPADFNWGQGWHEIERQPKPRT